MNKPKTQSQRLRGALFIYWDKKVKHKGKFNNFEDFYRYQLERIIDGVKRQTVND